MSQDKDTTDPNRVGGPTNHLLEGLTTTIGRERVRYCDGASRCRGAEVRGRLGAGGGGPGGAQRCRRRYCDS